MRTFRFMMLLTLATCLNYSTVRAEVPAKAPTTRPATADELNSKQPVKNFIGSGGTPMPMAVDDQQLNTMMARQAIHLHTAGKTVKLLTLISQLNRASCQLQLPALAAQEGQGYEQLKRSTLMVGAMFKCNKCRNWHVNCASGFAITPSTFVTNYHVVNTPEQETLLVMTSEGQVYPVKQVLAANKVNDVAILQIDGEGLTPAPLNAVLPVGSHIRVLSHPDGQYFTLTEGIISRYSYLREHKDKVLTMNVTADYAKGSSGGPVFDDRGQIVGLVASTNSIYYNEVKGHGENLQMVVKNCIPIAVVMKLIDKDSAKPKAVTSNQ